MVKYVADNVPSGIVDAIGPPIKRVSNTPGDFNIVP